MLIRASIGSQAVLGLASLRMLVAPTTIYLLQYSPTGCSGGCIYCPQSRRYGGGSDYVSRIEWPPIDLEAVKDALRSHDNNYSRVCLQSILRPSWIDEYMVLAREISRSTSRPISAAVNIMDHDGLVELREIGVDRIGVGLDAVSPHVFVEVGKPGTWNAYWRFIRDSIRVFGEDHVTVHIILGLGETEEETIRALVGIYSEGARAALFAYTHAPGTMRIGRRPDIRYYRRIQVLNYLLSRGWSPEEIFSDSRVKPEVAEMIREHPFKYLEAVLTSGCPGCNRPFYNERPRGPIYNYPSHELLDRDKEKVASEIRKAFEM